MSELLEITMLLCFGASWPMNVIKSWRARTARGKSLAFLCLIEVGYVAGVASKLCCFSMYSTGSWWAWICACISATVSWTGKRVRRDARADKGMDRRPPRRDAA